jgi:hypothetical protein
MATKNNPGQFDCYAKAEPDEPMFTLLARDKHAPAIVRFWALLRLHAGEDPAVVKEALECALAMDLYRSAEIKKPLIYADDAEYARIAQVFMVLTKGLDEHPDSFGEICDCDTCRSYGDDNEGGEG